GLRTTQGSPIHRNTIPTRDAGFVARMKQSGAIVIGKTNTAEFGLGSQTYNPVFGTTLNAFDRTCTAGGSSGGAAVALATQQRQRRLNSESGCLQQRLWSSTYPRTDNF